MPERRFTERLRHETEIVEAIRRRLPSGGTAAAALPLAPLYAGVVAGDVVVAQAVDPLAAATGSGTERDVPLGWLRAFHAGTTSARSPWSPLDTEAELDAMRDAWGRARPEAAETLIARTRDLLRRLEGLPVERCAVHGDFWSGNLARRGEQLRVYDWEWAREAGTPFFDLWTWSSDRFAGARSSASATSPRSWPPPSRVLPASCAGGRSIRASQRRPFPARSAS